MHTFYIDTLAYTNRLRDLHPIQKLAFASAILFIALLSHPPTQIAILFWMTIWNLAYARIPAGIYLKMIAVTAVFLLISLLALVVNLTSAAVYSLQADSLTGVALGSWYIYISRAGISTALEIAMRALSAVSCLFFAVFTVPFSEILQLLRKLGCPLLLTELLLLMYRFIFVFLQTATQLWIARESRNGNRSWKIAWGSLGMLVTQLFFNTFKRYRQLSLTLASRGFTGEFRVWHSRRYQLSLRYALEAFLGCFALLGLEFLTSQ